MITATTHVTVTCDTCAAGLTTDPDHPAGPVPAVFPDRPAALAALAGAPGWARRLDGRLLCSRCADRVQCLLHGHDYGRPGGWRVCACDRSLPTHSGTDPDHDPVTGQGCGWLWRLCGRCDHLDERHVTDPPPGRTRQLDGVDPYRDRPLFSREVQPGGHIRHDTPAGLGLPTDQDNTGTDEETVIVGPHPTRATTTGGDRG